MSYALSRPTPLRRSGMLFAVVGLHAGVFLLILAAKTVAPQIAELPLIVDLVQPAEEQPQKARPQPVVKPQALRQKAEPAPKTPLPPVETTQSQLPAPAAAIAAAPEPKPAPAAPAGAPSVEAVIPARFDADYLKNPAPPYPPLSRRLGEEGKVVLRVSVTPQGTADSVEIKTSSGSARLDETAQRTVRNWKFVPAKRGETAVQSWVLVPIIFKLEQ